MAQARNGMGIEVYGAAPIPAPDPKLSIYNADFYPDKSKFYTKIQNSSSVPADSIGAQVSGTYDYCPVGKTCSLSAAEIDHCTGAFCPYGQGPAGVTLSAPLSCYFESNPYAQNISIGPNGASVMVLAEAPYADSSGGIAGCMPCDPKDGRCANISAKTITWSWLADNDATWDKAESVISYAMVF
jgi:hypothetical protein